MDWFYSLMGCSLPEPTCIHGATNAQCCPFCRSLSLQMNEIAPTIDLCSGVKPQLTAAERAVDEAFEKKDA